MITVYPIDQKFQIIIEHEDEKVVIIVQPLTIAQRSLINSKCISMEGGDTFHDRGLSSMLTLKHSIKDIKGVKLPNGENYKLDFEEFQNEKVLTDKCVETLLNSEMGYKLNFYAYQAIDSTPHVILNPVTEKPVKGVEFKTYDEEIKKK